MHLLSCCPVTSCSSWVSAGQNLNSLTCTTSSLPHQDHADDHYDATAMQTWQYALYPVEIYVLCNFWGKKIISETSKGIHCKGLNLKRWILLKSFWRCPSPPTPARCQVWNLAHPSLQAPTLTFCLSVLRCKENKKCGMAQKHFAVKKIALNGFGNS